MYIPNHKNHPVCRLKVLKAKEFSCSSTNDALFNAVVPWRVGLGENKTKPCGYDHRTSTLHSLVMKLKPTLVLTLISAKCYTELFF